MHLLVLQLALSAIPLSQDDQYLFLCENGQDAAIISFTKAP